MTAALIALSLGLIASPALCLYVVTRYLNQRDAREAQDRQVWANRVQSPETAVVQSLAPPDGPDLGPPDTEWREHERLMREFAEEAEVA